MRSLFKVGALGLATLVACTAFVGCSSDSKDKNIAKESSSEGPAGHVGLNLIPVDGITINSVHYLVNGGTAPGGAVIPAVEGDLPTPGSASNFSFGIPLRVGTGYSVSLTAESAETGDSITCTGSAGPFAVTPNTITFTDITLTCVDNTNGSLVGRVRVVTDACPQLTVNYAVATPFEANIGSTIQVLSQATDSGTPPKPITYEWSGGTGVGTFSNPTAKDTTFTCTGAGTNVLITVTANNGQCSETRQTVISCNVATCGNGQADPGEDCDPSIPGQEACPSDCNTSCGDGAVEFGEQCEPPNTAFCTATCQNRPIACGDGFHQPPPQGNEACDPTANPTGAPPGVTCQSDCTLPDVPVCGNSVVQPPETCDPPTAAQCSLVSGTVGGVNLGTACTVHTTAACLTCEQGSECVDIIDVGDTLTGDSPAGSPAAGVSRRQLYYEAIQCARVTGCGATGVQQCYCGTANTADCSAGSGNGPCKAVLERALETNSPTAIISNFMSLSRGGGVAMARLNCDRVNCASACGL
jgi:hypothetical protein